MTEEIIIDGVNVAGCEFYQIEANELYPKAQYCGSMRNTFCENEPNCYYKQLKRFEQENKELKKQIESQKGLITVGGKQQYQYLQRIDELKQENQRLFNESIELLAKNIEYKSALEEIREIADDTFKVCDDDCGNARKIKLIIDKINEVLSD